MSEYKFPAYIELSEKRYRERFGLDFEQFSQGQIFKHRPGYTFTQQDNIDDSLSTLNQAMLHYDSHYAAGTEFEKPLMVTTIILQKLIGMSWKTFYKRKRILQFREVNMLGPVFAGDTLYAESEIIQINPDSGDESCGLVTSACRSYKPDGSQTCEIICDSLIYKKAHLPFSAQNY